MKKKGYLRMVNGNEHASKSIKLLFSILLLPTRDIERSFLLIKAYSINHGAAMDNLFNYYQR